VTTHRNESLLRVDGVRRLLTEVEKVRLHLSRTTDAKKKSQLGQFLTPERTAAFMAGLFAPNGDACRLLDAGAGIGSLSAAFLDRWHRGELDFQRVEIDAFEIDRSLHSQLAHTLAAYESDACGVNVRGVDFIHAATDALSGDLFASALPRYSHAILNPPYKKIGSSSSHRLALRRVGIETVNLYSAFVALSIAMMAPGGQVVAIIPRSFCNGPYYRPFRDFLLERVAIRRLHLFGSRSKAFKDDAVLQENVIIHAECGAEQGSVTISTSTDDTFSDLVSYSCAFESIVSSKDAGRFIHIPDSPAQTALERRTSVRFALADVGVDLSTGPVVDFRLKEHLRAMPAANTVPLLYPGHFAEGRMRWPIPDLKKSNAIARNSETEKWLYPSGYYCVVRRFSSKEEVRRIVASVVEPCQFDGASVIGFENHLNVFHDGRRGLPQELAYGLAVFLNSTAVDEAFRRFNGHTQVNATDLKRMKYPSREALLELGHRAAKQQVLSQMQIDEMFDSVVA
jgi:adenine-specific DNA-methyltransferase